MKKWMIPAAALIVGASFANPQFAFAEEDVLAQEETASETVKDRPEWLGALKTEYKLTDEQIKQLKDSGLSYPQMAMTSRLAEKSGKPIDEVLKMRTEQKMGWGKIAKELGVAPKEIGQSVASVRHEMNAEKKAEKKAEKAEKRAARAAKKESKKH